MDTRLDRRDQLMLPHTPLELPDAKRRKSHGHNQRRRGKNRAAGACHGT